MRYLHTWPNSRASQLALSFGGSKSLNEITLDQVRRFTETAGLPMRPVQDIVRDIVERTGAAWGSLAQRELLPAEIRRAIDTQIQMVAVNSKV